MNATERPRPPKVQVSAPVHKRLRRLAAAESAELDRQVTLSELLEKLLDKYEASRAAD